MDKLSEDIQKQIWFESIQYIGDEQRIYRQAATAWAHWKAKHDELLTTFMKIFKSHNELTSEYQELRERASLIETALQQFVSYHETGLLPDRFTYEKGVEALKGDVGYEP